MDKIKEYCKTQFSDIKSNPKCIIKKWWFWILIISIIYGSFTDIFTEDKTEETNSNVVINEISSNEESEEERIAREEKEKKEQEEKAYNDALKERQKRIDNNSAEAYAYTEKIVKENLKSPSTAKFLNKKFGYNEEYSRYVVSGSVDSQNSFGATLRANFYAEYNQDLVMIYFVFDNQVLLDKR